LVEHVLAIREDADRRLQSTRDRLYFNERLALAAGMLDITARVPHLMPQSSDEVLQRGHTAAAT
jgi:hypothetical protein